jgi:hypothetical protein
MLPETSAIQSGIHRLSTTPKTPYNKKTEYTPGRTP